MAHLLCRRAEAVRQGRLRDPPATKQGPIPQPLTLRVQVANYHILTQNLYHNSYYRKPKYLINGYMDPLGYMKSVACMTPHNYLHDRGTSCPIIDYGSLMSKRTCKNIAPRPSAIAGLTRELFCTSSTKRATFILQGSVSKARGLGLRRGGLRVLGLRV